MSVVVNTVTVCRFRLLPNPEEKALLGHCRDARYVWNLAVEQQRHWQPGRNVPGFVEQCRQLTEARAEYAWLRAGSQTVQQQALRDFAQAMSNFFNGTHRRPTRRKAGVHEGFRQVALKPRHVERVNRRFGRVWVPKVGWVRFRLSRPVPAGDREAESKRMPPDAKTGSRNSPLILRVVSTRSASKPLTSAR
jgi:putative transposase